MANTKPTVDSVDTLSDILNRAKVENIHIYQTASVSYGLNGEKMTDFDALADAGACGFTDDGIPLLNATFCYEAMQKAAALHMPISLHEEDKAFITNNGINAADCRFLDLFSGSGGIGIEALSRGAESAVFVEKNPKACACIRENLTFTKLAEHGKLLNMDVLQALRSLEGEEAFDCIFMDPPYNKDLERQVLEYLKDSSLANTDTLIVTEADLHTDFSYVEELGYELSRSKEYKTNKHIFLHKRK